MYTRIQPNILYLPRPARLTAHVASRLRSPDIDAGTVSSVLKHYGLDLVASPQNMPNARRNHNLVVHTQAGRAVLKLYRRDWSPEVIAYEHSILQLLADRGFSSPRLLTTASGESSVSLHNRTYCMFEYVGGINYSLAFLFRPHRMQLMRTAGQALASLHVQLADFQPAGSHHLGFASRAGDRLRDEAWHRRQVMQLVESSRQLDDPNARWLVNHAHELVDRLTGLAERLREASLPYTIIHGDFGLHNLIFQNAHHVTIMDFELARLEWRLSDLVSCLSKLRNRTGNYDIDSVLELTHSYQRAFPISADEWQWFPSVWAHYKLAKALQYWSSYFETSGPMRKLALARDAADQAGWLQENPSILAALKLKRGSGK